MAKNRRKRPEPAQAAPSSPLPFWKRPPVWLFAAALLARLAHLLLSKDDFWLRTPLLDDNIFVSWADVIQREGWLARSLGSFDLNPGYPYLLALLGKVIGRGALAVFAFQHAAGALVPVLLYYLTLKVFDKRAALLAGLIGALYGPAFFYESRFLGEFWIYLLNLSALACLAWAWRNGSRKVSLGLWTAAGLCLGLSAVLRPNVLVVLPLMAGWGLWSIGETRLKVSALLCFGLAAWLPMLPFQLRNRAVDPSRGWGLTTASGGVNLYLGNNPEADGLNKAPSFIRYGPGHEYQDFKEEAERRTGAKLAPAEVSRYWTRQTLRWAAARPSAAAYLLLRKAGYFWNHSEPPDNFFLSIFDKFTRLGPLPLFSWGLVAPLGLAGLLLSLRRSEDRVFWLLHGYVAAYFCVNIAFYILSRYRFPTAAGLIPFAAFAASRLISAFQDRAAKAVLLCLILACFGLSRLRLIGDEDPATSHYSMAVIYANQGWQDKAVEEYRVSIQADPTFKASYLNLGILQAKRGDAREAVWALEGALRLETNAAQAELLRKNIEALRAQAR